MPLLVQDVASELSYAYLHAVAAAVGCECQVSGRHSDGWGVDARLYVNAELAPPPSLTRFPLEIQLKATATPIVLSQGRRSFRLPVEQYDKLRTTRIAGPLLLVVLQLAGNPANWVGSSARGLTLRGQAWWASLHGAPASANTRYQQVYLPQQQGFTPRSLQRLLARFARREEIRYES